eukprot:COSAG02_NODE_22374_length_754_cov_1.774046_1_plen_54_part_10
MCCDNILHIGRRRYDAIGNRLANGNGRGMNRRSDGRVRSNVVWVSRFLDEQRFD